MSVHPSHVVVVVVAAAAAVKGQSFSPATTAAVVLSFAWEWTLQRRWWQLWSWSSPEKEKNLHYWKRVSSSRVLSAGSTVLAPPSGASRGHAAAEHHHV